MSLVSGDDNYTIFDFPYILLSWKPQNLNYKDGRIFSLKSIFFNILFTRDQSKQAEWRSVTRGITAGGPVSVFK